MSTPEATDLLPEPPLDECERVFDAYKPELEASTALSTITFNSDAVVVHHNAKRIVDRIETERVKRGRPLDESERKQADRLRALSLVLVFASLRAKASAAPRTIRSQMARARKLRRILLLSAQACAAADLVPEHEVEDILAGTGDLDRLRDNIALVALFRRHAAALAAKTPVTEDHLGEASTLSTSLLGELGVSPETDTTMATLRDRCWTLLQQSHVAMWRLGAELWGPEVDEYLPKLGSRPTKAKSTKPE